MIKLKRAYDPPSRDDGMRILVDRLWPRGVSKQSLRIDLWLKDIAPSTALRVWFGHDPSRWTEFRRRYESELKQHPELVADVRAKAAAGPVTFVYAARDTEHSHALALQRFIERSRPPRTTTTASKRTTTTPPRSTRRKAAPRR